MSCKTMWTTSSFVAEISDRIAVLDYNHPLAGKPLIVQLKILEVENPLALSSSTITWDIKPNLEDVFTARCGMRGLSPARIIVNVMMTHQSSH